MRKLLSIGPNTCFLIEPGLARLCTVAGPEGEAVCQHQLHEPAAANALVAPCC